ncbi:MAG TPA: hypothetical protein VGD18_07120 [Thiobacillaceae bacterium]
MSQTDNRRPPLAERFAALLASSFLLPLLGEILLAVINDEPVNYLRSGLTAALLALIAALLYAARTARLVFQRARAAFLLFSGLAAALHGFLLAAMPEALANDLVQDMAGMATLVVGLSTFAIGWFYFRVEAPANVSSPPAPRQPVPIERISFAKDSARFDARHHHAFDACWRALNPQRLHYLAYYEGRNRVFTLDVFDQLTAFAPIETTHAARRERYHEYGAEILELLGELNPKFSELETGPLIRMVFDVEQGALYYFMISSLPAVHIIGLTLDQEQIHATDEDLETLAGRLRELRGLLPITRVRNV